MKLRWWLIESCIVAQNYNSLVVASFLTVAQVITFPEEFQLPPHFSNAPLVAYKAWAILHSGQEKGAVEGDLILWLDANTELRKPIHAVWDAIEKNDYFFTLAGHKFPTFR